ncbi:MAG TPA: hypothetical protein VEY12_04790 [Thermoplasmata archaeon]|nr:hypothetical protein [Thermoplasmata archaeon]
MDESYLEWLRVLPGFSAEKARRVADLFPTFEHLRAATPQELASVEGLTPHDLEALHRLVHDSRGRDEDGHLFLCPECGSFAGPASTECPFCGVSFGEASEEASVHEIDRFLKDEQAPPRLCADCGAVMAGDARRCEVCGREYTRLQAAILPGLSVPPEDPTRFCPQCGAYQEDVALECTICGHNRNRTPEVAANGHNGKGLAEGFLSRWQRVAEAAPRTEMDRLNDELEEYEKLLEADPSLEKVWAKRGRVLAKVGRAVDAAESLAKAAELDPAKDEEYRLEVLDILKSKGDLSLLPTRWGQVRAAAAPSAEGERLLDALRHYDALLEHDPELVVAWRTKGEILERIGRVEEARACFERADALERREDELLKAQVVGLRAPGLVSSSASLTGRTNGLSTGHVNGRTNGRVNGLAEGRVNGLTNGAVNGVGTGRGATNGLGGFTNGRTNGLVNGNGFTNGRRGRFGPGRIPPQPHWARSLVGIAAVVALMVLVPILASVLSPAPGAYAPIAIDHNFSEWARFTAYVNTPPPNVYNPDINILEVKVATDVSNLYVYAKVQGLFFQAPWTNGTESLLVFVDTDRNPNTGYPIGGMGADILAIVTGWDGQIQSTGLYLFNETGIAQSNDFKHFLSVGSVDAAFQGNEAELRIPLGTDPASARVLVYGADNQGYRDGMAGLIQPGQPTVVVGQKTVAPGIITNTTATIQAVNLFSLGGSPTLTALNVSRRGSSMDSVTLTVYRDTGNGTFGPQDPFLGSAVLAGARTRVPVNVTLSAPTTLWIRATWANMTAGRTFGLLVTGISGNGTASLRPADTTLDYQVAAPSSPTVDGAFADWAGRPYGQNPAGAVVNPSGNLIYDANIDLLATAVDVRANFTGYLQVSGVMLGGQDVPMNIVRPGPYTPPTNTTPPPGPYVPQTGVDVMYAYIDADNSSATGIRYRVGNLTYGFDYAVSVVGRNGQVNSSALYAPSANGTWQYVGPAQAALDAHRLELAVNASQLNLRAGYRVVYVASDWQQQYDVAVPDKNVATFTLGAFAKPPKNGPVVSVAKTVSATSAVPGQSLTYLIYFNNTGQGNAKWVWINDTLPNTVTYVSASTAPSIVFGSMYGWLFRNVAPGSHNTLQVNVQVNGNGTDGSVTTNTASLVYTDVHGDFAGSGASAVGFAYHRPAVTIVKTVSPAQAVPGQYLTYTIYYNNTGSVPAGTVSVVDTLPSGLVNITTNPPATAVRGRTYYWNFTNVAPGPHSLTILAQVSPTFTGSQIVNWGFLNYTSTAGYTLAASKSSAVVAIPELSDFAFVIAVPFLIVGLRRRARARARRTSASPPDAAESF